MRARRLDSDWKAWLAENIDRQSDPDALLGILIENNFMLESIRACMGEHFPADSARLAAFAETDIASALQAPCDIRLTRAHNDPRIHRVLSDAAQIYVIDDFMSDSECDVLVGIIGGSLRSSTVTIESPNDRYFRTSSTSDLSLLNNPVVRDLDEKIARIMGIRPTYSEGIQGQHYAVGEEFKLHTDFFEPGSAEYSAHGRSQGNRTWTFMVYLNAVTDGGGTSFPNLECLFRAQKGKAVI